MDHYDPPDEDLAAEGYRECADLDYELAEEAMGAQAECLPEWDDEDAIDAADAIAAIDEANSEGTISQAELRHRLGR